MQKIAIVLLAVILLLSLTSRAFADEAAILVYSQDANSGTRHELCTTLDGTSVDTYYTGEYTFDTLSSLNGDALLQSLRKLMSDTHTHTTTYGDCRDYAVITDCENGDGVTINLIYSSYSVTMDDYINNATDGGGWNREHVWPVSLGGFSKNQTPGCDLHHIRPSDKSLNGKRGNDIYGEVENGNPVTGTVTVDGTVGGHKSGGVFEPLDNVKGDVARICLYMYARYGSEYSGCKSITNVFQSIDVLLKWHEMDPVDTWEMGRNEVVYGIQGNRNVFIDYPELAWLLFDEEIPADITTPSAIDRSCEHANVEHRNATEAGCDTEGNTGDIYCADCGRFVAGGSVIPATGHQNTEVRDAWNATCKQAGCTGDTYCLDCGKLVKVGNLIPATGEHTFGEWTSNEDTSSRSCTVCGFTETVDAPANDPAIDPMIIGIAAAAVIVVAGGVTAIVIVKKKKTA